MLYVTQFRIQNVFTKSITVGRMRLRYQIRETEMFWIGGSVSTVCRLMLSASTFETTVFRP